MKLKYTGTRNVALKESPSGFFDEMGICETPGLEELVKLEAPTSLTLPMSEAKSQGQLGTCTSFAVIGCLDYFHGLIDLSEACITHEAERRHGECTAGLAIVHAMQTAKDLGVVTEEAWPYDGINICWNSPPPTNGKTRYRFNQIAYVFRRPRSLIRTNIEEVANSDSLNSTSQIESSSSQDIIGSIKAILTNRRQPITVSIPVWWESSGHFDADWEWGPNIKMPTPTNLKTWLEYNSSPPNIDGWHAIAIHGFDDQTRRFEFKNSWGKWWGNNGFGTIPYDYITSYSDLGMHGWL
ncbi:hypothetical protein ACFL3K_00550 [Pseudomonadota bacterium]